MKKKVKYLIMLLIALLAMIYAFITFFTPLTVTVEEIKNGDLSDSFSDEGRITAIKEREIFSAVSGTVKAINFHEGDLVKTGEAIIEIDSNELISKKHQLLELKIRLNQVKQEEKTIYGNGNVPVALSEAQRNYATAKKAYEDAKILYESGGISQNDLIAAENTFKSAESTLEIAKAQSNVNSKDYYTNLKASLNSQIIALEKSINNDDTLEADGNLYILAPFNGRLSNIEVKEGQMLNAYNPVASIYEPGKYEIEVYPLAVDGVKLNVGDEVELTVLGKDEVYKGRIKYIATAAVDIVSSLGLAESRLKIVIEPITLPDGFGPGFTLDIYFSPIVAKNVLTVPSGALLPHGDEGYAVYIVDNKKALLKPVITGMKAGGSVEITEGLNEGDIIISDSKITDLKDGIKVKY